MGCVLTMNRVQWYVFIEWYFPTTRAISVFISCADKTKYMVMSRDQNAGRIHSVRIDNSTVPSRGWKSLNIWEQL